MPQYSYANYNANGVTTQFTIPFAYLAQAHVHVFVSNVEKLLGVDFTIDTGTNKVVFGVAPANSTVVTIRRITPRATDERTVDFSSGAGLQEQDLDDSALQNLFIEQELLDDNQSTLRGPVSDGTINELPVKASRAGKVQAYDENGQPVALPYESVVLGGSAEATAARDAAEGFRDEAEVFADSAGASALAAGMAQVGAEAAETAAEAARDAAIAALANKVSKAGDTMTGALTLPGRAANALEAVPKQQAESIATTAAQTRGGTAGGFTFRNLIINGKGTINQRGYVSGTNTTGANQYTLDRWRVVTSGQNLSFSVAGITATMTAPVGGAEQVIEGAWNDGTAKVINWTGTATCTVNGVSQAKGSTFTVAAGSNITVRFTSGTFTDVQVESGTITTVFEVRPPGVELALCQRYYEKGKIRFSGNVTNGLAYSGYTVFRNVKRTTPTVVLTNLLGVPVSFSTTVGSTASLDEEGVAESRIANATGQGLFVSSLTANAEL